MKSLAKTIAHQFAPSLMAKRANRQCMRLMDELGIPALEQRFISEHGATVHAGPFQGLQYIERSAGSSLLPKLIGSYEQELNEELEKLLKIPFKTIIDVGCAEGYFAVGCAWRVPNAQVFAFDTNPGAQALCQELSNLNKVKVHIGRRCTPATLEDRIKGVTLVICDCEGYEVELLDPIKAPSLLRASIIVEIHGTAKPLLDRFVTTHHIVFIFSRERDIDAFPLIAHFTAEGRKLSLAEFRHGIQQWAVIVPTFDLPHW